MRRNEVLFLLAVSTGAALVAAKALHEAAGAASRGDRFGRSPAAGEPRDIDIELFRRLIEQERLSGREAGHYRRVVPGETGAPAGR